MMKRRVFFREGLSYTLYEEDNRKVALLDDASFDVLICDGPYGITWPYCEWDRFNLAEREGRAAFYSYYHQLFSAAIPKLKSPASIFIFNYPEGAVIIAEMMEREFGLIIKRWISWHYDNHFNYEPDNVFFRANEAILFYSIGDYHENTSNSKRRSDVLNYPLIKADECDFKEGAKPLEVVRYVLDAVSVSKGSVLSLFAGSGTDFLAASCCGMSAQGFELNPRHVDILTRRLIENGFERRV